MFDAYVENIRSLLNQVKVTYAEGDKDMAHSLVTNVSLDNFEFLKSSLDESNPELVVELDTMIQELQTMISSDTPMSEVNQQVDDILAKMDTVATIVPEFGSIAMMILAVSIISIVAVTAKTKVISRF